MSATPLLATRSLSCGYSGKAILSDITLSLGEGRFVCLIGKNGTGKSTLMRTLSGLLPSIEGEIEIDACSIGRMSPRSRAQQISVVLTGQPVPGYMSARRYVALGRYPHLPLLERATERDHEATEAALEAVGAADLAERPVAELSDGERQRVGLARALAQSARLMLLDEPTAFLDVSARARTMETLRQSAHQSGRLIITSSHEIELILRTADTVILIRPDRSIVQGAPEDLVINRELDHLFTESSLQFDYERGGFAVAEPTGPPIQVEGDGLLATWTRHMVQRIGFRVARTAQRVIGLPSDRKQSWTLKQDGERPLTANTLQELADTLRE